MMDDDVSNTTMSLPLRSTTKKTHEKEKNRRQIEGRRRTQKKFKFFLLGFRDLKLETKRL